MPIPQLSPITGTTLKEVINGIEKQRKELGYILTSLDNSNVTGISIGSTTEFEEGYDPSTITFDTSGLVTTDSHEILVTRVSNAEGTLAPLPGEIDLKVNITDLPTSSVNFATTAGNANNLEGNPASAFSLTDHTHLATEHVTPQTSQAIQLQIDTTTHRLYVYVDGVYTRYIDLLESI